MINRAPFNALVDDDGSGTTGTVWNKNQIKTVLLDPIDAEGDWVNAGTPTVAIGGPNAGNWVVGSVSTWAYSMNGKNVTVTLQAANGQFYIASNQLNVMLPNNLFAQQWHTGVAFVTNASMPYEICAAYLNPSNNWITVHRNALANFPAATGVTVFLQMSNVRVL
jgi:hypothetical protein